jgi:hypothetical protein
MLPHAVVSGMGIIYLTPQGPTGSDSDANGAPAPEAGAPDDDISTRCEFPTRADCELLARSLFNEKERLLQEGEEWDSLSDKAYWVSLVRALFFDLRELKKLGLVSCCVVRDVEFDPDSGSQGF